MYNKYISSTFFEKNPFFIKIFFILSFFIFGVIVILITFYANYTYQVEHLEEDIRTNAKKEINKKIKFLKNNLNDYRTDIYSFKDDIIVNNYLTKPNDINKKNLISLFSHIITTDKNIMQIRFIEKNGNEKIRLERDYLGADKLIIKESQLQNKSHRYYFKELLKTKDNFLWTSKIDLNKEFGKIQKPYVPTIRIAMPFYSSSNFEGFIIFNIFMKNLLEELTKSSLFNISLIDNDGEIIVGNFEVNKELKDFSWSRALSKDKKIEDFLPKDFKAILSNNEYSSKNICTKFISDELGLKQKLFLILEIKNDTIAKLKKDMMEHALSIIVMVLFISAFIGLLLSLIPEKFARRLLASKEKLEETQHFLDEYLAAMNTNNIITKSDLKGTITYINDNFIEVTGYKEHEVIGKPHSILRSDETSKETFTDLWKTIQAKKTWTGILKNKKKDGTFYYVDNAIMPILNTKNEIVEYIGIRHDITDLILQKESILASARKDSLTNCGNRMLLFEEIHTKASNNLAVIDINDFSSINDFYGHTIGDIVIKKFAELLLNSLDDYEFKLYRLHSDKFAILNTSLTKKKFVDYVRTLNKKMTDSIIKLGVKNFDILTTVGISFENNYELLLTGEIANKHAKKVNQNILIYEKKLEIEKAFEMNLTWVTKIKNALAENKFLVHYQPIFNNKTKKIEKYEALVRLEDEDGTLISPFYFLSLAKKSKQYINITKKVIDLSFEKFKNSKLEFSINLTIEDVLNKELNEYLIKKIKKYNVGKILVLELVESENIEKYDEFVNFIKLFKSFGCKIAIDDFGTGYSNFEYLIKVDADYVKIDGSMIKDIEHNQNSKEIVRTIVEFAKKMNFKTIAEYVSNEEIYNIVNELGIEYSQGYYIGKPQSELID